jgi:hypothetical protein
MATAQGNSQAPREELERVLSSACFVRSEGLSRLLRFLVERQLEGRAKETMIFTRNAPQGFGGERACHMAR